MEDGMRRTVWFPTRIDDLVEETRKELGMNRSAFIKYAVVKLLQDIRRLEKPRRELVEA